MKRQERVIQGRESVGDRGRLKSRRKENLKRVREKRKRYSLRLRSFLLSIGTI